MGKARLWMENLQETRYFFQIWGSKSTLSNQFLSNSWIQKRHSRHLEGHVNSDSYTPEGDGKSTVGWQSQAESKPPLVQDSREIEMIES